MNPVIIVVAVIGVVVAVIGFIAKKVKNK